MNVVRRIPPLNNMLKKMFFLSMPVLQRLGVDTKGFYELSYWRAVKRRNGKLSNGWYEATFTKYVGIPRSFYSGKKVLDIGCGPCGSLEWLDDAAERVGLDPLADKYRELGID